jgi:hypothetical protein
MGAATPIWLYVGHKAMSKLPPAIRVMVRLRARRRPYLSAKSPMKSPANGRARNPTAKTPNALRRGTSPDDSEEGKKEDAKYTAR